MVTGAVVAGHDPSAGYPFPDVTGMVYFVLGAVLCPLLALCLARLLRVFFRKNPHFVITTLIFPSLIAFSSGVLVHRARVREEARASIRQEKHEAYWQVKKQELLEELVADPGIALRDRWYEQKDFEKYRVFVESLQGQLVSYSPLQLENVYQAAPDMREDVLAHPACDLPFLEKIWGDALRDSESGGGRLLIRVVKNPAASRELLMRIEEGLGPRTGGSSSPVRQVLDARLRGEDLVLHENDLLRVYLPGGELRIYASGDVMRGYEWDGVTRMAALASNTTPAAGYPAHHFQCITRDSGQAGVTKRGEFWEGVRRFDTMAEATRWIGEQSTEITTVYRNDGLLVSCSKDKSLNLLTVEIWQILVDGTKPSLLAGANDEAMTMGKTER